EGRAGERFHDLAAPGPDDPYGDGAIIAITPPNGRRSLLRSPRSMRCGLAVRTTSMRRQGRRWDRAASGLRQAPATGLESSDRLRRGAVVASSACLLAGTGSRRTAVAARWAGS